MAPTSFNALSVARHTTSMPTTLLRSSTTVRHRSALSHERKLISVIVGDPAVENRNWYGYPTCHSVYGASQFTDKAFRTGDQFVLTPNATFNDEDCARRGSVPPRLSFQAHSAPMDAAFDRATENMFITFHGSWNRPVATGYKVVQVAFRRGANGQYEPVEPATSMTAAKDIFWSQNEGSCTSSTCFRPCGITFDRAYSRLIVGSDRPSEGELFMLIKT